MAVRRSRASAAVIKPEIRLGQMGCDGKAVAVVIGDWLLVVGCRLLVVLVAAVAVDAVVLVVTAGCTVAGVVGYVYCLFRRGGWM